MNKTKVIVKIGENNNTTEVLKELILSGIDAFCLDQNIVSKDFCIDVIDKINSLNKELKTNVAIMLEAINIKVHLNKLVGGKAELKTNDKIRIYMNNIIGDETKLSVDYPELINDIKYDSIIKLSNGFVQLQVLDKGEDFLLCKVIKGGPVYTNGDVIVPGIILKNKSLLKTAKDSILFASKYNLDYVIIDYVTNVDEILDINDLLIDIENNHIGIISKIENEFALNEIDDIINISDGIIVSREDLGVEIPIERIPGIQKSLINKCHFAGKISIVSTEVITDKELTKAEVSDIANAVLDGTDAVMVSDKKVMIDYPVKLLEETMKVILSAEENIDHIGFLDRTIRSESQDITGNVACSVAEIANRLKCKAIVAPTISGYTARKMSRFRPKSVVIAISTNPETVRSLSIYFGVYPILIESLKSLDDIVEQSKKIVKENMDVELGDKIIITGGYPFKKVKHTNLMEIEEL